MESKHSVDRFARDAFTTVNADEEIQRSVEACFGRPNEVRKALAQLDRQS